MLPEVRPSSEVYGQTADEWFGGPIAHRRRSPAISRRPPSARPALPGQRQEHLRHRLLPADEHRRHSRSTSQNNLLTTIGWGIDGRDDLLPGRLGLHRRRGRAVAARRAGTDRARRPTSRRLAASVPDAGGVYFVPAFVGLGAPYWDPYARGAILGLTRGTTAAHIARAGVGSRWPIKPATCSKPCRRTPACRLAELKVDGGASVNDLLMQFQADVLGVPVRRPVVAETTALGAAYLAGLAVGYWQDPADVARNWASHANIAHRCCRPSATPAMHGGKRPCDKPRGGRRTANDQVPPGPGSMCPTSWTAAREAATIKLPAAASLALPDVFAASQ